MKCSALFSGNNYTLTFILCWANSADDKLIFFVFFQREGFVLSSKLFLTGHSSYLTTHTYVVGNLPFQRLDQLHPWVYPLCQSAVPASVRQGFGTFVASACSIYFLSSCTNPESKEKAFHSGPSTLRPPVKESPDKCFFSYLIYLGPVVQSIVSLTSSLVVKMLTVLVSTVPNEVQVFLLKKWEYVCKCKSYIFSAKI